MSKWNIKASDFRQWVIDADDETLQEFVDESDFRQWVIDADDETLQEFVDEIEREIIGLEQDDFFGTEGLNKRFS